MSLDPSQIKQLMELGANCILILCLSYAIKGLWGMVQDKDKQISLERDKREELIKESIKASTAMLENTERILEAIQRIEHGVLLNARTNQ